MKLPVFLAIAISVSLIPGINAQLDVGFIGGGNFGRGEHEIGVIMATNTGTDTVQLDSLAVIPISSVQGGLIIQGDMPFTFKLPQMPLLLGAGENVNLTLNASILAYIPSLVWHGSVLLTSNGTDFSFPLAMNIIQIVEQKYAISLDSSSINTSSGAAGNISLDVANTGNVPFTIEFSNTGFIKSPAENILNPSDTIHYFLSWGIPANFTGNFTSNISFLNTTVPIDFSVTDTTPPNITFSLLKELKVDETQVIVANATDNIGITETLITVRDPDGAATTYNGTGSFVIDKAGGWFANITSKDQAGNIGFAETDFQALPTTFPEISGLYDLGSIKTGRVIQHTLFLANKTYSFNVTMKNLRLGLGNATITAVNNSEAFVNYKLILSEIPLEENKIVEIKQKDSLTLSILTLNNVTGDLNFDLEFSIPNRYIQPQTTTSTVLVRAVNYNLIGDYNTEWFDNAVFCKSLDEGSIERSKLNCTFEFPATIDLNTLTMPVSPVWFDTFTNEQKFKVDTLTQQRDENGFRFTVTLAVLILAIIITVFMVYFWPELRMKV